MNLLVLDPLLKYHFGCENQCCQLFKQMFWQNWALKRKDMHRNYIFQSSDKSQANKNVQLVTLQKQKSTFKLRKNSILLGYSTFCTISHFSFMSSKKTFLFKLHRNNFLPFYICLISQGLSLGFGGRSKQKKSLRPSVRLSRSNPLINKIDVNPVSIIDR